MYWRKDKSQNTCRKYTIQNIQITGHFINFIFKIFSRKPIYIHAFLRTKSVIKPTSSFKNNKYLSVIDIGEVTRDFFTTPRDCTVSFKI